MTHLFACRPPRIPVVDIDSGGYGGRRSNSYSDNFVDGHLAENINKHRKDEEMTLGQTTNAGPVNSVGAHSAAAGLSNRVFHNSEERNNLTIFGGSGR